MTDGMEKSYGSRRPRIFTIGHSDRSIEEFIYLLESSSVKILVDIRSNPASVRFPYFERRMLSTALDSVGIDYRWFRSLGGNRSATSMDALHTGLPESLRAYAVAMNRPDFEEAVSELVGLCASAVTAVMCAERDYKQCHRYLLADKLEVRGVRVTHILDRTTVISHEAHPDLSVEQGQLWYRSKQLDLL